ncbi:hypothetical protein [Actinoplanes sp. G11-F43]|uniref:hypothetical protein n=1 Tax=Actinoplanes sp. G11-F43 TaxID=3424130 RepID=UPI003D356E34
MPTALHALLAAALTIPALPATPAAAARPDCLFGNFTARSQADLAKVTVLDPGPLTRGLPALADVRIASAKGTADSTARPAKTIASGLHADARILGLPAGGAGARHAAPGRSEPSEKELVTFQAAGLATARVGKSTAHATWDDGYHCGRPGPLTRSATMLGGLSVLDGSGDYPAIRTGTKRTSLLKIGPVGSAQSATDLVDLGRGRTGVRAGAGVALSDLSLFAGTPQQISIRVVSQPTLEAISGGARPKVTYRPAVLEVNAAGKPTHVLKDSGATVSLGLLGGVDPARPSALEARISLGEVKQNVDGRQVRAEAATVRVEVKLGMTHLLDVALGHLSVAACAPAQVKHAGDSETPRPRTGGSSPAPSPTPADHLVDDPSPEPSPAASSPIVPSPSSSPSASEASDSPAVVPAPAPSGGTGGGVLALTGSDVTVVGFAGAGLVAAGLISLLLTRRRRPAGN